MKNLKIYFTSDMHGFVYPTDYASNELKPLGMLNIINSFTKDENTLIIDGGDTIQGSPFTTFVSKQKFDIHPIAEVLNAGQYDFITLGNHDFNYGYDYLSKYLNNLNAKCICTNVLDKTNNLPIETYAIKTLGNGLKAGIIGFTTDFINIWEQQHNLTNFNVSDTMSSIKSTYNLVKPQVDILIGIYHGGFEKDLISHKSLSKTKENQAYKICEEFDFDLLLTGHQHMPIDGEDLHGTYIAQTPQNGLKYLELDLSFDDKIVDIKSTLKTPDVNPSKDVYEKLLPYEKSVQEWLDIPVGFLDVPLNPTTHLDMALKGSYLANFINTVQIDASSADIACTSFANSIKGFNKDVTVRDIVSTYIYPNTLVVLEVTGKVLKEALLRSSEYLTYNGEEVSISDSFLKPKVEHYNYDYYSNLDYGFTLNKNAKNTLSYVRFKGRDVLDSDCLTLVMNNYRSSGAGGYEFFTECTVAREVQVEMTEIIINYFTKNKNVEVDKSSYITITKN